jgi:hypothetical protein
MILSTRIQQGEITMRTRTAESLRNVLVDLELIRRHLKTLQEVSFKRKYDDIYQELHMYQIASVDVLARIESAMIYIEENRENLGTYIWDLLDSVTLSAEGCMMKFGIRFMIYSGVIAQLTELCSMHDIVRGEG